MPRVALPRTAKQTFVSLFSSVPPLLAVDAVRRAMRAARGDRAGWALIAGVHALPIPLRRRLPAGQSFPDDLLFVEHDRGPITAAELRGQPTVLLFYRGNWCPLCMAQVGEKHTRGPRSSPRCGVSLPA